MGIYRYIKLYRSFSTIFFNPHLFTESRIYKDQTLLQTAASSPPPTHSQLYQCTGACVHCRLVSQDAGSESARAAQTAGSSALPALSLLCMYLPNTEQDQLYRTQNVSRLTPLMVQ